MSSGHLLASWHVSEGCRGTLQAQTHMHKIGTKCWPQSMQDWTVRCRIYGHKPHPALNSPIELIGEKEGNKLYTTPSRRNHSPQHSKKPVARVSAENGQRIEEKHCDEYKPSGGPSMVYQRSGKTIQTRYSRCRSDVVCTYTKV